ncbi:BgTH12-04862 [Blumeria graminis f. sp. triticale]|uniref:BgTH12-04862 n=1 Tax=Blumeria graminis f. sp. triticale TaxID=1689686 RepID=A0A9W4CV27_BLUGR|nr:BgTH12-04862 [Blumeria graminis f. sp. triticale]
MTANSVISFTSVVT